MSKERLDIMLVKKQLFQTRERARSAIMSGIVYVNNIKETKPGTSVEENSRILIKGNTNPYVSRGGLKLEKAINIFSINLDNKIAIDVGASTGGFTDCMLKHGISKVFSIDVGYGQLAWEIRNNPKVIVMERTNIRSVTPQDIGTTVDFVTIDVSFISLKKVLPTVIPLANVGAALVCLVKPQFEAGRDKVGKKGVVRDPTTHRFVLNDIISFFIEKNLRFNGVSFSPIKGPEGNIEYLIYFSNIPPDKIIDFGPIIYDVVSEAHKI